MFLTAQQKTNTTLPQSSYPKVSPETALLVDVAVWYPSAPWTEPKKTTEETTYGNLSGENMQASVTASTASLSQFENVSELKAKGFTTDINLAAGGPGSSVWGYKSEKGEKMQVIIFSYKAQPTNNNPNEPLQFNCPCKINMNVFVSNPFSRKIN